ncbi:D-Ala-D-Ala carboxypeptidase family metallohydrolase [Saccharopolyspora spinosa]|uniref:D-Ala-D-Ala carboxypeptidase family metallohydrolase n=1 Tax=Saccharopolyspora spinosa TaxID=60894 RepID=UPI00374A5ACD
MATVAAIPTSMMMPAITSTLLFRNCYQATDRTFPNFVTDRTQRDTQQKLNALEDSDGSIPHFGFSEFHSKDGRQAVVNLDESTVKENVRRLMYKLEAIRKKAGDAPIQINSGFRSKAHNGNVGGAPNS